MISQDNLPHLSKKILYIDQFALSYMVRALHPDMKATGNSNADFFWLQLYRKLDRLVKMQVIICPQSDVHLQESVVSNFFEPLEKMYHLLSRGSHFIDQYQIKRFQITDSVRCWIRNLPGEAKIHCLKSVVDRDVNLWLSRDISFNVSHYPQTYEEKLREYREKIHQKWIKEFHFWKNHTGVRFEEWMEDFYCSLLQEIFRSCPDYRKCNIFSARPIHHVELCPFLLEAIHPISIIHSVLHEEGIAWNEQWSYTCQYLCSEDFRQIPFIKLYALFYASFARKAGSGQKKIPDRGMTNDLNILSLLLPYCDAMFIDNQCRGCLEEKDVQSRINYPTRVFSLSGKEDFLAYLEQLEEEYPLECKETAEKLYRRDWIDNPTKLYSNE